VKGEEIVANVQRTIGEARGDVPAQRPWEPMSLTRIGTFGDILRGPSGMTGDANTKKS
jgi:hypothetical protein